MNYSAILYTVLETLPGERLEDGIREAIHFASTENIDVVLIHQDKKYKIRLDEIVRLVMVSREND